MASTNLWVGNVSADVGDWELKALFERCGSVVSVVLFPHRSYAFVHFKEIEAAILAKRRLQGRILRGIPLKIEFSRREQDPHANEGQFPSGSMVPIESDCMWRGIIAKGGDPICLARCVPIGEWTHAVMPEVVNFSERTELDSLSKYYLEDAIGFNIVSFLPDSEDEFADYTSLMQYLCSEDSAGVAKLHDGTFLFLVPPSDFLTNVLKVAGPQRLYGVVFKFSQVVTSLALTPRMAALSLEPLSETTATLGATPNVDAGPNTNVAQSQQLQTDPHGVVQESAETEADRNQRYSAMVLFAASLLSRARQPSVLRLLITLRIGLDLLSRYYDGCYLV